MRNWKLQRSCNLYKLPNGAKTHKVTLNGKARFPCLGSRGRGQATLSWMGRLESGKLGQTSPGKWVLRPTKWHLLFSNSRVKIHTKEMLSRGYMNACTRTLTVTLFPVGRDGRTQMDTFQQGLCPAPRAIRGSLWAHWVPSPDRKEPRARKGRPGGSTRSDPRKGRSQAHQRKAVEGAVSGEGLAAMAPLGLKLQNSPFNQSLINS